MSAKDDHTRTSVALRLWAGRWRLACAAGVAFFLWAVAQFWLPGTGFTSLISIGSILDETKVTALRRVPHYVYDGSAGYDGAYYVQIALHPSLSNPRLLKAIDNLPYRARRILFPWVSYVLGLGQAAWVVQAFALLNVLCWLALAWVLLRWFPPVSADNFFRWFCVLFSHGVCMSVRNSLVDGPSLLLVALAMLALERGRRKIGLATLALAGLGKETSLLAVAGFAGDDWRSPRRWPRLAGTLALAAAPLAVWIALVQWRFGPAGDAGFNNFALPFAGLAEKWGTVLPEFLARPFSPMYRTTALVVLGLTVQFFFFLLRRRPGEAWWRVGAAFALMMAFVSTPVWEGYPGASTRVLLPMTLAFNLLVPRGRAWLAVLVLGNLGVFAGFQEFNPPPRDFLQFAYERGASQEVTVVAGKGWYAPENSDRARWRWSERRSELHIRNDSGRPAALNFRGRISAVDARTLAITLDGKPVLEAPLVVEQSELIFRCIAPPGASVVVFATDKPNRTIGDDSRALAFSVSNVVVSVSAVPQR